MDPTKLVDTSILGGWVRAGVASGLGVLIAKFPILSDFLSPEVQTSLGVVISGIAVGAWSHYVKKIS